MTRRFLTLFVAALVTVAFVQAQQQNSEHAQNTHPTLKEHQIGETSQEFFLVTKMAEKNGMLLSDYCHAYLNDQKVKKTIEKAKKGGNDPASFVATLMWEDCNNIQAALVGQNVEVDLRFAAGFGSGSVQFVAGRLASMSFVVKAPFNEVVEDMTSKLNAKPLLDILTFQNSVGAIVKQRRAIWKLPNTFVKVAESHSLEDDIIGTEVSVSDPEMMKHRTNSLN